MRDIFVGRQPIYNRNPGIFGYEMLFRANNANDAKARLSEDDATSSIEKLLIKATAKPALSALYFKADYFEADCCALKVTQLLNSISLCNHVFHCIRVSKKLPTSSTTQHQLCSINVVDTASTISAGPIISWQLMSASR